MSIITDTFKKSFLHAEPVKMFSIVVHYIIHTLPNIVKHVEYSIEKTVNTSSSQKLLLTHYTLR